MQLVEHQLKELQKSKEESKEESEAAPEKEGEVENNEQEAGVPLAEQHKNLKLQLRATTGSLKEKLNAKETQLK